MKFLFIVALGLVFNACSSVEKYSVERTQKESKKVNEFFAQEFAAKLERFPTMYTYMGQKKRYHELNNISYDFVLKNYKLKKESLKKIKKFDYNALDEKTKLSYRLYKKNLESQIRGFKYTFHNYFVNQMHGAQTRIPAFLISMHRIDDESDAKAYIKRVKATSKFFSDLLDNLRRQEKKGIKYPNFVFDKVIMDSKKIITGHPFSKAEKAPLYADFQEKIIKTKISSVKKKILTRELEIALITSFGPAYEKFISYMIELKKRSSHVKGVWALPNGKKYYNHRLKAITATDMRAEEIYKLGLSEVERVQNEMRGIIKAVNFNGDLKDFFESIKKNKDFFYPSTKKGKAQYVKDVTKIIKQMRAKLDKLFITMPKAKLVVKPIEAFREKSTGIAFYQPPALDGSRPGIYYINLSDMSSVAKYDMEVLAYHEGLPGHHMDNSINQEIKGIPMFRKFSHYTSFGEGWGLYAEYIPKEIGFYKDPYSDFGRLSMELWRAARLVVDTGIHHYKWTREKSIAYLQENTPSSQDEIVKGVERYFVMPGQATAYKIGQLKILSLRKKAEDELKDKFDIREFHEAVLGNGAIPLYELEYQISNYIKEKQPGIM